MYAILGANGGIGSALARQLVEAGESIVLAGRNEEALRALSGELDAPVELGEATRFEDVERMLGAATETRGPLEGVACCVGSILLKPAHLTTEKEFEDIVATNLKSAFATVRGAARAMRREGGSIVLVSSAAAQAGLGSHEAIASAKAGVEGLVRAAAATYAARGIRVNAVAPGLVRTKAAEKITSNPRSLETSISMHALGRIGEPDEVARVIRNLLSQDSSWITGQVLAVDGGLSTVRTR